MFDESVSHTREMLRDKCAGGRSFESPRETSVPSQPRSISLNPRLTALCFRNRRRLPISPGIWVDFQHRGVPRNCFSQRDVSYAIRGKAGTVFTPGLDDHLLTLSIQFCFKLELCPKICKPYSVRSSPPCPHS